MWLHTFKGRWGQVSVDWEKGLVTKNIKRVKLWLKLREALNVRMSTVMFHFVTVHFQDTFLFSFSFLNGCTDESVWMGKEAEGWGSPKNAINSTHFILPHTLPIYSLDIVLYISAENPLGHCGSTSVPLEHIKAYLKWVFELKCFCVLFFHTILIAIITSSNCGVPKGNANIQFFSFAHDHICLGYSKYSWLWNESVGANATKCNA